MKKIISILGSTGSIGLSAFKIIDKKKFYFNINILSANRNIKKISQQILKYKPNFFLINDFITYKKIKRKFKNNKTRIVNQFDKVKFGKSDFTISAIPGIEGLPYTLNFLKISKKMLIANKESIICGWNLISRLAKDSKTKIIPIDSEHYSIFNLLKHYKIEDIRKIYITASGGPF